MSNIYRFIERRNLVFIFVAIVAFIVLFNRLGGSPVSGDGFHYAEMAKEMAVSGKYLTPLWNYEPYFVDGKPPMLYWLLVVSGAAFGFNSAPMRIPSAVVGFAGIIFLFLFVRKYFSQLAAFLSSISLVFTQQYLSHARDPVTDIIFAVFFAMAVMSFWAGRTENKPVFYYLMGLFAAFSLLTRQLPGLFIYAVIGAYIIAAREFSILKQPHFYGGVLLSALLALPWYAAMYYAYGYKFISEFFACIYKFGIDGSTVSPDYLKWSNYPNIILPNYQPWLLFMLYGIFISARDFVLTRKIDKKVVYVFMWAFVPLAIFQALKVKATQYIVPVYFGFSIFTAFGITAFIERTRLNIAGTLVVIASLMCIVYIATPLMPETCDSDEYKDTIKLVPHVRQAEGDIIALDGKGQGYWHFNNGLMFYADRRVLPASEQDALIAMNSDKRYNFVMFNEDYENFKKSATRAPKETARAKNVILFTN